MKPIWIVDDDQSIRFVLEKALMSRDNVASMKVDNVASGAALGLSALGVPTPASLASVFTLP